eukprot:CAMPEP_0205800944 /NCGR_PEP_ID=MMETSP0205-20121125/2762_1 /ASSEMBLY_ACC=CAM_ASM_000278 /TAXON_ID=36767 /ORGANISM="Euplotes focardii, Strain TN1" /LENGTH=211 /DNA_ID=CAMNT_0053064857 /DNA_START=689 /DNA_END=1321 /DNA_ORIENTATION=+
MKDLFNFYDGTYLGEGIINSYLRLLEIFHEYNIAKAGLTNPQSVDSLKLIKILDIHTVNEVSKNWETPYLINEVVINELKDFFNYDIIIIPIFKPESSKLLIVIIEILLNDKKDCIKATLYDREREDEEEFEDISIIVQTIIQLVIGEENQEEFENKIEGDTEVLDVEDEADMVPSVLQIVESKVLHEGRYPNESLDEYRHKMLDRLIAFH